jgi:hypothetical protein
VVVACAVSVTPLLGSIIVIPRLQTEFLSIEHSVRSSGALIDMFLLEEEKLKPMFLRYDIMGPLRVRCNLTQPCGYTHAVIPDPFLCPHLFPIFALPIPKAYSSSAGIHTS